MTDELKKALSEAHTEEEKKAVAEKFKDEMRELSPEELEGVAGGVIDWATPILGRFGRRTGDIIGQTPDTPKEN